MNWAFTAIGFVVGGIAALIGDFSAVNGAVLGAAIGFCLDHTLQQRKRKGKGAAPDTSAMQAPPAQPPVPLADRVARLEATVETLTREVASLRGQLAGAKAGSISTAATAHTPAGTASVSAAPSATSSAPVPPSATLPPRPPAQPAAARADAPASLSAPAPAPAPAPVRTAAPVPVPAALHASETPAAPAPAPSAPPTPPKPREPDFVERAFRAARDWLLGGNTVVRVGIVVLFFGVAFLLKYAADNNMLPIEFRLAGTALAAAALLAIGWRVRARRAAYGLVLQGGGVGILYLTIFAATKLYALLPVGAAFPLMVAVCALSAFLAVRQNALPLASWAPRAAFSHRCCCRPGTATTSRCSATTHC